MAINLQNYEQYFLDYIEGDLSLEQRKEVDAFLKAHPELREELEEWGQVKLSPLSAEQPAMDKTFLRKTGIGEVPIDESNYEEFLVRYVEDDLGVDEKAAVATFVRQHKPAGVDLAGYQKTILQPNLAVRYPGKASLKKGLWANAQWKAVAIAAVVGGLLFLPLDFGQLDLPERMLVDQNVFKQGEVLVGQSLVEPEEEVLLVASDQAAALSNTKTRKLPDIPEPFKEKRLNQQTPSEQALPFAEKQADEQTNSVPKTGQKKSPDVAQERDPPFDESNESDVVTQDQQQSIAETKHSSNASNAPSNSYLTLRDAAEKKIKEFVLEKEVQPEEEIATIDVEKKLIKELTNGLSRVSSEVGFYGKDDGQEDYVIYEVSIGKFRFERKKKRR